MHLINSFRLDFCVPHETHTRTLARTHFLICNVKKKQHERSNQTDPIRSETKIKIDCAITVNGLVVYY